MHIISKQSRLKQPSHYPVPARYAGWYPATSGAGRISKICIRHIPIYAAFDSDQGNREFYSIPVLKTQKSPAEEKFLLGKILHSAVALPWSPAGSFPRVDKLWVWDESPPAGFRDGAPVGIWEAPRSRRQAVKIMHKYLVCWAFFL